MQKPLRFVCNLSWTTESVSKPSAVAMAFEDIGQAVSCPCHDVLSSVGMLLAYEQDTVKASM